MTPPLEGMEACGWPAKLHDGLDYWRECEHLERLADDQEGPEGPDEWHPDETGLDQDQGLVYTETASTDSWLPDSSEEDAPW